MGWSRTIGLIALAVLVVADTSALANGGKSKRLRYSAEVALGAGVCRFEVELEPLLFSLQSLGARYRVARMTIRNGGNRGLTLSPAAGRIDVQFAGGPVLAGILDLGTRDRALWDSLPADLRAAIAYPHGVEAGEEESVTVGTPQGFRYAIAGLSGGPVILRDRTAVPRR